MNILTKEELIELSGYKQNKKIFDWLNYNLCALRQNGFIFKGLRRKCGLPIVEKIINENKKEEWHPSF